MARVTIRIFNLFFYKVQKIYFSYNDILVLGMFKFSLMIYFSPFTTVLYLNAFTSIHTLNNPGDNLLEFLTLLVISLNWLRSYYPK